MIQRPPYNPNPFGSVMQGRNWSETGRKYRFGFNTQEKDNEVAGEGNSYTAEFWQIDTRLGRRFNIDPRPDISLSLYSILGNSPLIMVDFSGDTIKVVGSKRYVRRTNRALDRMKSTSEGLRIYNKLHSSTRVFTIRNYHKNVTKVTNDEDPNVPANWAVGDIGFNGNKISNSFYFGKGGWLSLAHELAHAEDVLDGLISEALWTTPDRTVEYLTFDASSRSYITGVVVVEQILMDEVRAVDKENKMRAQAGLPLRTHYKAYIVRVKDSNGDIYNKTLFGQQLSSNGRGSHPSFATNYNLLRRSNKERRLIDKFLKHSALNATR